LFRENRYTVNNLFKGDHDLTQLQRALVSFAAGSLPNPNQPYPDRELFETKLPLTARA
jgi:hypothetical protein